VCYLLLNVLVQSINVSFCQVLVLGGNRQVKCCFRLANCDDISSASILFSVLVLIVLSFKIDSLKLFALLLLSQFDSDVSFLLC
jgi:hypothetical protein